MKKDLLVVGVVIVLLAVLIKGTNFQTVDEYYLTHIDDITSDSQTVTVSIRCDEVLKHWDDLDPALQSEEFVPGDGVILAASQYVLRPGDTAFDLLERVTRYHKIQMEYQGADKNSFSSVYIKGIHYLYEFSCGPLSGWMYRVNGEVPQKGCSQYELKNGDVVEWVYSCTLGQDTGEQRGNGE